ncbi:MAG TPA: tetratricopeptide repeat protein [Polyangiaceae bacterium]|nr:tetratricopeptide repeat protein [Polyangiaceae bacterium]
MTAGALSRGLKGGLLAAALLTMVPRVVAADGNALTQWDFALDPALAAGDKLHRELQTFRYMSYFLRSNSSSRQEQLVRSLRLLEEIDAEHSRDIRLRFDLGALLLLAGEEKRAASVLEGALAMAPDHPSAIDAYWSLAIAYVKLGRFDDEIDAYEEFLRRSTAPEQRVRALCNRAESQIRRERLGEALRDYRDSLVLQPEDVLCHWGYAVALDRSGDAPAAMVEAKTAITFDPLDQALSNPGVFFLPAFERFWYEGLGSMARAQQIDDPAMSVLWWEAAVVKWAGYLAFAPADDRWVPLAKAHQASCQRRVEEAKKKALKLAKGRRRVVVDGEADR